jgi:hypothetical protein
LESYQAAKHLEAEMLKASLPAGWTVATVAAPEYALDNLRAEVEAAATTAGISSPILSTFFMPSSHEPS